MNQIATPLRRRRRLAIGIVLGTTVLICCAGAYAFRTLFARPGEAALRYVPADSVVVASIDLTPSPTQTLAFKHIDDSLTRNGMSGMLEKSVLEIFDHSKATEALRPLVLRSGAVCVAPRDEKSGSESALAFVAVTDGAQASQILQKAAFPQFYKGLKYYKTGKTSMLIMVVDDLLVVTDQPQNFLKVQAIRDGSAKPITSVPEFIAARGKVADDANFMCYLSPKIASSMLGPNHSDVPLPEWAAIGLAIRDGGIGLSCSSKMDLDKVSSYQKLAQISPVRSDLFQVLPTGSYGMIALSQPSSYFDFFESSMKDNKDVKKGLAEAEDSIQKGIGLSVEHDLLPALKGDAVAALYPSQDGQPAGIDVLLVVDDMNGADPADAVERFQTFVENQASKEGNAPKLFEEKSIAGGREFRINDKTQQDMRESMSHGVDGSVYKKDLLFGNKTAVFAVVGKAVIAASSQGLLDKAVACYESKTNGLTGDAKFEPSEKALLDGSQSFAAFSLSRIAEGVKNTISTSKMNSKDQKLMASILNAFQSLNEPLYIKGKTTPSGEASGGVFIPLDYDKIIDMIGDQVNKK